MKTLLYSDSKNKLQLDSVFKIIISSPDYYFVRTDKIFANETEVNLELVPECVVQIHL